MDAKLLNGILKLHRKWLRDEVGGKRADLSGACLSGANLSGACLSVANLSWADLSRANLSWADLSGANLGRADLSGANLGRANLNGSYLSGANLGRANLSGANLSDTNLSGANPDIFPDLFLLRLQPSASKLRAWKFIRVDGGSPFRENRIIYVKGKSYSVKDGEKDERIQCAPGLNVATLPWCLKNSDRNDDLFIEVEFTAGDILAVPFGTDGKFRVKKLKVIRSISKKDAESMMREYLKPYGKEKGK